MRKLPVPLIVILLTCIVPAVAQDATQSIAEILNAGAPPVPDIDAALGGDRLAALKQVYSAHENRPLWSMPAAKALLDRLPGLALPASLEPLAKDVLQRATTDDPQAVAERDLLLSALYGASAHLLNPAASDDFATALTELAGAEDQVALLTPPPPPPAPTPPAAEPAPAVAPEPAPPPQPAQVAPQPPPAPAPPPEAPALHRITVALDSYRQIESAGGWPTIADGPKLQKGDAGDRVDALRQRLILTGDLAAGAPTGPFDDALQAALQHFQTRHGLEADGVAGADTIATLNVPISQRIAQLAAAHQRAAARQWGDRYLVVNIPAADFRLVTNGNTVLAGPAILGRAASPTPVLDGSIDRLQFHPVWKIPQRVADARLWPLQDADASYFYNQGIHVSDDGLTQDPGYGNPLGRVKFLFDNPAGIALHDTPDTKGLHDPDRFTSLGCIAVARADDLARALLSADPAWPAARIDTALTHSGETVTLAQPLPLHIVYDTAWVDDDGTVEFRADLYGLDAGTAPPPPPQDPAGPCGS